MTAHRVPMGGVTVGNAGLWSAVVDRSEQKPRDDDLAAVALVLSLIGLVGCLPVGVAGLVMGYRSRDRIRRSDGALGGGGTARVAIVVGWIAVTVSVLALLAFLVAAVIRRST